MMLPRIGNSYLNLMHCHDDSLKEALKQKMLNQEDTFRKQVLELHRLYQIQTILMKNLQLKEVVTVQSAKYSLQGISQRPSHAELSASHYVKQIDQPFLNKGGDGWGTSEMPVEVDYYSHGEAESSLDEVKLSLSIGGKTMQKQSCRKLCDEKVTSVSSQHIIDLEESTHSVLSRDIELKSAIGCAARSTDSGNIHGIQSSSCCENGMNKDIGDGIKRSQSLTDESKTCPEGHSLNQVVKKWLRVVPGIDISSLTKAFTSQEAECLDLNKPLLDESPFHLNDIALESSVDASSDVSQGVAGEFHKGWSPDGISWRKPNNICSNEVSAIIQKATLNFTIMASNSTNSSTNISGSKSQSMDLDSCFRSQFDHREDHDCLNGSCQHKDAKLVSNFPGTNRNGKTMTEGNDKRGGENAVSSLLCRRGDTVDDIDSSPTSCKSGYIATDPSNSLKTVQAGTRLRNSDLSRLDSFHNSELSVNESYSHGEPKSGSSNDKKEGSAHDDALIQKGAVSLMYFVLESSRRECDCIAEDDRKNGIENGKRDQPQCSSDSFESMVLKLQESNVEDYCVSSIPLEVNDMDKKDYGIKLRRGRRMKDFQKDILPGLASLSRHEICEDIRIIEGVIRSREYKRLNSKMTSGKNWFTPARSRRSRPNYIGRRYYS